jgi:hypothetical protein
MKTIFELYTQGDSMTLPGGIALRIDTETHEVVVHSFSTDRETETARHYFQGSYFTHDGDPRARAGALADGLEEFARRARKAAFYDTGGALNFEAIIGKEVQAS